MNRRKAPAVRRAKVNRRAKRVASRRFRHAAAHRRWHWDFDGLVTGLGACGLFLLAGWMGRDTYLLQHRGEVVPATVLDMSSGRDSSIEVRYTTKAGRTVVDSTTNYYDARVGGTIDVIYDPQEPTRMQANDWGVDYVWPGIVGAGGVAALGYAVTQLWRRGKRWE
ncbi:hypothetical protein GCM10009789_78610 [Kribbella sancticallisti]|uniref:DUF3592 domain-containing protein n=1 Tax=Kribbella sancticallisti TaxID=460087 RepID=A0ABN2EPQ4_9ACTN